jgi:ketosteroid isomerase-like protein
MTGLDDTQLVRRGFEAVARGDLDTVAELLDPAVRWHGADDDETGCHNRDEALDFIRDATARGVSVELLDVQPVGDHVVATLKGDNRPAPHGELVTVRNGKVTEMVVYETPEDAAAAAIA